MPKQKAVKSKKVDLSFYLNPDVFSKRTNELESLKKTESDYLAQKLNEQLQSEILKAIGPGKPGIAKLVNTIKLDYRVVKDSTLDTVIKEKVLTAAKKNKTLAKEIKAVEEILDKTPLANVRSLLHLGLPVKDHPVFARDVRGEKALAFAKIINLKEDPAVKLAEKDLLLEDADDASLEPLVRDKILTAEQKKDLLLTIDLSRLSGENMALIKALKTEKLKSMEDFISWDKSDWSGIIKDHNIPLPEGEESIESYAENLRVNIERTFPSQYFLNRVVKADHGSEMKTLSSVAVLSEHNDTIVSRVTGPENLNWTGISMADKERIEGELDLLGEFANMYGQMGIADIVNDRQMISAQKEVVITQRLSALDSFYKNNAHLDLYLTDFISKDTEFDWTGVQESDRPMVKKQMMAYQRTLALSRDFETSRKLLAKRLDSAIQIASMSEDEFRQASGLDLGKSREIYLKAQEHSVATSHFLEAIRDSQFGLFKDIAMSNQGPLANDLREIEGFDELFGNRNFCDCEHCRSILSPAAYFTDLMYFVQEKVSKRVFIPSRTDQPLYLKNRRPDLWKLNLTCQNTTTEIPYLQVVNDILEQHLMNDPGIQDVYDMLQNSNLSTQLPFNLPLDELRLYLSHFGLGLHDIYKTLKQPKAKQQREKLGISEQELQIITTPNPAESLLRFGNKSLTDFDVQEFIALARIKRTDLDDLLKIDSVPEIAEVKVKTIKDPGDIQQFREVLDSLTDGRLDLIHRFVRFWKKTAWTIREFDLVLNGLKSAGLLNTLEEKDSDGNPRVLQVADLVMIQEALNLSPEELCAMVDDIPQSPVKDDQESLYERLFDLEEIFDVASTAADGTKIYNTEATIPADKTQGKVTPHLLAGLGISEAELGALFGLLQVDIAVDVVDRALISNLFRHARIAKGLKISIEDLVHAVKLVLGGNAVTQLSQIHELVEFSTWVKSSPFAISEVTMIVRGEESSLIQCRHNVDSVGAAVLEVQKSDEADKKALLKAWLQKTFNLSAGQLENEFLPALVSVDIDGPGTATALNAAFVDGQPQNPSDLDELVRLVREFERLDLLFSNLKFDYESITYFTGNKEVFGIADLKTLQPNHLRNAAFYKILVESNPEMAGRIRDTLKRYQSGNGFVSEDIKTLSDLWRQPESQVQSIVDSLTLAPTALEAVEFVMQVQQTCQKLGVESRSLTQLTAADYPGLKTASNIAIGAFASKYADEKIRQEKLEPYNDRLNTLKRDALCDYILARRDRFTFTDQSDLYNYFLLDVEMSGCFRTSRLVAAITSLQLYVHRCLVNLEQSDKDLIQVNPAWIPADEWEWRKNYRVWEANRKVFLYPENYIEPALRDTKSHIFKELEEELLQEKITNESAEATYKKYLAHFSELAKLRYAGAYYHSISNNAAFVNVSGTRGGIKQEAFVLVHGVFLATESEESVYYLFTRTNVQPYQYYYRTYNHYKGVWGNWKKMELAIEAEEISAVVNAGRLYVYWTEVQSKEINKVKEGSSEAKGVVFKVFVKYAFLDEKGAWSSPQRIPVGHAHFTEKEIYWRIGEAYPDDEDERDRKHDTVFERFHRSVFRKPYALLLDDIKTPVELAYIWSQNRVKCRIECQTTPHLYFKIDDNNTYVDYDSKHKNYFTMEIPDPIEFYNDQSGDSKSVTVTVKVYCQKNIADEPGDQPSDEFSVPATVKLVDAPWGYFIELLTDDPILIDCIIDMEHRAFYAFYVVPQTLSMDIFASEYHLSLSKNEIADHSTADIRAGDNCKIIHDAAVSFLREEYGTAFKENGDFSHYVEDGTKGFTSRGRVLEQTRAGDGWLRITDNGASNHVHPEHIDMREIFLGNISLDPNKTGDAGKKVEVKEAGAGVQQQMAVQSAKLANLDMVKTTTILTDELSDILYAKGIEQFLDLKTQQLTDAYGRMLDFKGAYGEYYWEMFFHIPFLIAHHLNANQKFKDAKTWYEKIFNPTADETPSDPDHNWRFREFRNLNIEKLKDILTDSAAIEAYKKDPFDPHAIARLRLNAYQKTIIMKYIDNLLDWGDHLFAQDTRESINEAEMLYQLAADILGKRPVKLGKCETAHDSDLTYETIGPEIGNGSEFLITLEHVYLNVKNQVVFDRKPVSAFKDLSAMLGNGGITAKTNSFAAVAEAARIKRVSDATVQLRGTAGDNTPALASLSCVSPSIRRVSPHGELLKAKQSVNDHSSDWTDAHEFNDKLVLKPHKRYPPLDLVKQSVTVFCVPPNEDLLGYWDRVEDRLFKIRNCMNISGVRRSLALFQPPIDPMLLVRAKAAGLSLEDILAAMGKTPHYRFTYLAEKCKQFSQTVQNFGAALLSALEKKDGEELSLLRSVHERNILRLTKDIKKKQLNEARYQYQALEETLENVQNRIDYYEALIDGGLIGWEIIQQITKHASSIIQQGELPLRIAAGVYHLLPQAGSPFAITYGGEQTGSGWAQIAEWVSVFSKILDSQSASAGLEASFQRREEEWKHQKKLAKQEYKQTEKQLLAAEIRTLIAEKDLEIHEKNMEQAEELHDFYKNKFSNLGLYNYLASTLNRLYREAYNAAYDIAKAAESAYQFEIDDNAFFIANDNWQFDRAGLLAGERLLLQIQKMERAYIENNVRTPEITQSFSLALLDPSELVKLRQTGTCVIRIPEIAFEATYPGQYKRLIKSVRVTIPCIVGPYANVGARLTLLKGEVESEDKAALTEILIGKNTSITTSSANNDAGMFEFNFRDERYLPFEGNGAISEWRLELPAGIRSFDYNTISDVILHMSYTAREGDRAAAEANLAAAIADYASLYGLPRLFSLKHEFPYAFHQLLNPAEGGAQKAEFVVEKNHFPYLVIDKELNIMGTRIYLKPKSGLSVTVPATMNINGTNTVAWNSGDDIALPGSAGETDKMKGGSVSLSGTPVKKWTVATGTNGLERAMLDDILILVKYRMS